MHIHTGIVLLPHNHIRKRNIILDRSLGIIEGYSKQKHSAGSIISYYTTPLLNGYFINNIQLEFCPINIAKIDLLFLHHILEICSMFAPIGSCVTGLFELFNLLYVSDFFYQSLKAKKYFIFKLLVQLGIWPENKITHTKQILLLAQAPIDKDVILKIHMGIEQELEEWLRHCILQHPNSKNLQTKQFLWKK